MYNKIMLLESLNTSVNQPWVLQTTLVSVSASQSYVILKWTFIIWLQFKESKDTVCKTADREQTQQRRAVSVTTWKSQ